MNVSDYLLIGLGLALVLAFAVTAIWQGVKLWNRHGSPGGRGGHGRTSERVSGLVFIGYGLAFTLMVIVVLTDVVWLAWLAFLVMLAAVGLWLLEVILRARERRAARTRDLALGLPVVRKLVHPFWIGLAWFAGYVVVAVGGLLATAALNTELIHRGLLSVATAARFQAALPMVVVVVCAVSIVGGIVHVVIQMARRKREDERVARARPDEASAAADTQTPSS